MKFYRNALCVRLLCTLEDIIARVVYFKAKLICLLIEYIPTQP